MTGKGAGEVKAGRKGSQENREADRWKRKKTERRQLEKEDERLVTFPNLPLSTKHLAQALPIPLRLWPAGSSVLMRIVLFGAMWIAWKGRWEGLCAQFAPMSSTNFVSPTNFFM